MCVYQRVFNKIVRGREEVFCNWLGFDLYNECRVTVRLFDEVAYVPYIIIGAQQFIRKLQRKETGNGGSEDIIEKVRSPVL